MKIVESKERRVERKCGRTTNRRLVHIFVILLLSTLYSLLLTSQVFAQDDDDPAPPPLKLITKEEQKRLDGEPDLKDRTKLAVEFLRLSIDAAEKANKANDFDGMLREFGHFRALMDYTLAFLQKQDMKENRSLDNYKRFELSLRAAIPRIETIRRELPLRYEEYVRDLIEYIREARSKAIDPMFSDTVLKSGG